MNINERACPTCGALPSRACIDNGWVVPWTHAERVHRSQLPPWWRQLWNRVRGVPAWN